MSVFFCGLLFVGATNATNFTGKNNSYTYCCSFSDTLTIHIWDVFQMPLHVLEAVLQEVVLTEGDAAYLTLALTCKRFKSLVSDPVFRKKAHFAWLDGNDV